VTLARVPTPRTRSVGTPARGAALLAEGSPRAAAGPGLGRTLALVGLLALVVAGVAGYAIGASGRASDGEAATARRAGLGADGLGRRGLRRRCVGLRHLGRGIGVRVRHRSRG
jgi:hypothetical protein